MKKIVASILCFTLCAGMIAGCDDKKETTKATEGTQSTQSESQTDTESQADTESEGESTVKTDTTAVLSMGTGDIAINVYAMSNEVPGMIEEFFKRNPDMASKYKVTALVSNNDGNGYETKLNAALSAGGDIAPDLYVAEADYILPYTQGDLSSFAAPYSSFIDGVDGKITEADIAKYTVELGTNTSGELVALCYQCTGGAMIYSAKIAKEVFGGDDAATVEAAIGAGSGSWDKFIEAAGKLKEKGYATVSALGDLWNVCEKAAQTPWVVDGALKIDPQREKYLDLCKTFIENDYTNDASAWAESWYADMQGVGKDPQTNETRKCFCFFGPAWLINYVMGGQSTTPETGFGDWRVCQPPVGFWWGGSWLCVNKAAVENADKKEFLSKFVEWVTLDCTKDGLQYAWANGLMNENGTKDTVASGTVMKMSDGSMDFLGGQNPFDAFVKATAFASAKCKSLYDASLNGTWQNCGSAYGHGDKDKDTVIAEFKDAAAEIGLEV